MTTQVFVLDKLTSDNHFSFWDRLHGFWRKLPNFNLMAVSAEHGQYLKTKMRVAMSLSKSKNNVIGGVEESEDATLVQDIINDIPGVMDVEDGFNDDTPNEVCASFWVLSSFTDNVGLSAIVISTVLLLGSVGLWPFLMDWIPLLATHPPLHFQHVATEAEAAPHQATVTKATNDY